MSFSEWNKYRVGDIAKVKNGFAFKGKDFISFGVPVIKIKNVKPGKILLNDLSYVSREVADNASKYKINVGDILITMSGNRIDGSPDSWVGKVAMFREEGEYLLNQRVGIIEINSKKIDSIFLSYLLSSIQTQQHFITKANSSGGQANISPDIIHDTEFFAPDLPEQKQIASILRSIDDTIENNQQINKTLEEMAKAIFKEWFVDFNFPNATGKFQETEIGKIPVGWKVATFEDFFDADRGLSYKGAGLAESDATPMHNLNSVLEGGGYKTIGIKYYNGDYKDKHIVNAGELIVANTEQGHKHLLIGYPAIVPQFYGEHGIFSHHIYRLRPKSNCYLSPDFIFHLLLQTQVRDQVIGFANGTTVNMLKIEGLQKPKFAMPPKELAEKFGEIAKANRLQAEQNIEENQSLINLRDTLLPKLMKGEIEIREKETV